jgi:hypothetical protein
MLLLLLLQHRPAAAHSSRPFAATAKYRAADGSGTGAAVDAAAVADHLREDVVLRAQPAVVTACATRLVPEIGFIRTEDLKIAVYYLSFLPKQSTAKRETAPMSEHPRLK